MRAVGYFREAGGGGSLAEQSRAFLEFCRHNGYEAAAAFLDVAEAEEELPGFRQLLDFLRVQAGKGFMLVAVSSLSTLGDSPLVAARRYFQLASLGVAVVSIQDRGDAGNALLGLWQGRAQGAGLSEQVRAAMRRRAVRGEVLGRPPYGYRVGPKRRLQIVPQEGSVVRYIFRLYLKDGLGIRRIARRLNEEGLRTRRGGLWSMVTVRDILRNRVYVGTYSRFGVRVPASHPPLISPDDFQRVQERLDQRRPAPRSREVSAFLLSGLAYCGYCGNKMIGVTRKQRWRRRDGTEQIALYRYYQCESRTNRSLCDYHTRRAEALETEVWQALLDGRVAPAIPVTGDGAAVLAEAEATERRLRQRLRRLDKRLEGYLEATSRGLMDSERLGSLGLALATERLKTEMSLAETERLVQQQASQVERRRWQERALGRIRQEWERLTFYERQALLRELLDRVIVRDDGIEALLRM